MKRWDRLVDEFISDYRIRGIAESTLLHRERELFKLGHWLKKKKPQPKIEEIKIELIHEYIKSRTSFLSKASSCGVIGSMRLMGDYFVEKGIWFQNPLRWISGPKISNTRKIPKNYHRKDLHKIFEESFNGPNRYFRHLYPAVISVFYSSGLRKGELLSLNIDDWCSETGTLKIFAHKTKRGRVVPVPEVTKKCIENYLIHRHNILLKKNRTDNALFLNTNGERVNGTQLLVQFKRIAKRSGVDKATIHMFRHSCATGLIQEGVPLPQVQRILGHANSCSTFRYFNIADPDRRKAMNFHPVTKILNNIKENEYGRI